MIESVQAVHIAERLACLRAFPRGANRAGTIAEIAIALRKACDDESQAVAIVESYQVARWHGIGSFREFVASAIAPRLDVNSAHFRGYQLPGPGISDDEFLERVDAAAAEAIDRLLPLQRLNLEKEANRHGATCGEALRRLMISLWLDQHERQHCLNPEPLPVKGGAKLDHWGGEKVDHLRGWERPWFEGFTGAA
ncbi:MAG: hypothetical protein ABL995_09705, partial [Bryobacteraceae bacterium]